MTRNLLFGMEKLWRPLVLAALAGTLACNPVEVFINNTTSLGGDSPASRGSVEVAFVNNTPYFAIFSFGVYDPLNEVLIPERNRFLADADPSLLRLERNSSSDWFPFTCGRVISLGDHGLMEAIELRDPEADPETLQEGITFSDRLLTDPDAQTFTINRVPNQTLLLGKNYYCESRVRFTFELDDSQPNGVRIDKTVILP